jgi:hypothetical protein
LESYFIILPLTAISALVFLWVFNELINYEIFYAYALEQNESVSNLDWINQDEGFLTVSIEREVPISGSGSLRVDVAAAPAGNETLDAAWYGISSDFISIKGNKQYNYIFNVWAEKVNQLHAIGHYYDSNRIGIKEDYLVPGNNGTFKKEFINTFLSPEEAKFFKLEFWSKANVGEPSNYILDNIQVIELGRNTSALLP